MLDRLFENAALVLVVVPNNAYAQQNVSMVMNSLQNAQYGNNQNPYAPQRQEYVDPETVAVISAAINKVLDKPYRIKKIQFTNQSEDTSWSRIGRLGVIGSHDIQMNRG